MNQNMAMHVAELPQSIRQREVLVVEDSQFQRELLCALLKGFGFHCIQQVADGAAALEILRGCRGKLPIVLVDLEMPGMNGIELLQRLGDEQILSEVVITSAREEALISTVEGMLQAAGVPLLGSLQKPIEGKDLHKVLSKSGRRAGDFRAGSGRASSSPSEAELASAIKRGYIIPYYQPKVHLASGRITGYEVLARWQEPLVS